jgi:hypothetical protein
MPQVEESVTRDLLIGADSWLPPGLRENTAVSLAALIRARVLVSVLVCSMTLSVISLLVFVVVYLRAENGSLLPALITTACLGVACLNYFYFYKTANLDASGIFYSFSLFAILVGSTVVTGGYHSPVKIMLICCPILSFLISGRHEGFYNAALVFVVGIILLTLDQIDFKLIQIMPPDLLVYISGLSWFGTLVLIVLCLYIYDLLLDQKRSIRAKP